MKVSLPPSKPDMSDMVWIPAGDFDMDYQSGSNDAAMPPHTVDAIPVHRVHVDGFWLDKADITNEEFERFVRATGYQTIAERVPPVGDPGEEPVEPGPTVFSPPPAAVPLDDCCQWWLFVPGASWRHPLGPDSDIVGKEKYPVVHIAFDDAITYADWAGKRMSTEAEWEFAARGGLDGCRYAWGNEFRPEGKWMANIYTGEFPVRDTGEDGFAGLAPVAQFPSNGFGLYDMTGNVWKWCSDWYHSTYYRELAATGSVAWNPQGPLPKDSDTTQQQWKVQRGGSFLCTDVYCGCYIVGARGKGEIRTGSNHVGFRCPLSPSGNGDDSE